MERTASVCSSCNGEYLGGCNACGYLQYDLINDAEIAMILNDIESRMTDGNTPTSIKYLYMLHSGGISMSNRRAYPSSRYIVSNTHSSNIMMYRTISLINTMPHLTYLTMKGFPTWWLHKLCTLMKHIIPNRSIKHLDLSDNCITIKNDDCYTSIGGLLRYNTMLETINVSSSSEYHHTYRHHKDRSKLNIVLEVSEYIQRMRSIVNGITPTTNLTRVQFCSCEDTYIFGVCGISCDVNISLMGVNVNRLGSPTKLPRNTTDNTGCDDCTMSLVAPTIIDGDDVMRTVELNHSIENGYVGIRHSLNRMMNDKLIDVKDTTGSKSIICTSKKYNEYRNDDACIPAELGFQLYLNCTKDIYDCLENNPLTGMKNISQKDNTLLLTIAKSTKSIFPDIDTSTLKGGIRLHGGFESGIRGRSKLDKCREDAFTEAGCDDVYMVDNWTSPNVSMVPYSSVDRWYRRLRKSTPSVFDKSMCAYVAYRIMYDSLYTQVTPLGTQINPFKTLTVWRRIRDGTYPHDNIPMSESEVNWTYMKMRELGIVSNIESIDIVVNVNEVSSECLESIAQWIGDMTSLREIDLYMTWKPSGKGTTRFSRDCKSNTAVRKIIGIVFTSNVHTLRLSWDIIHYYGTFVCKLMRKNTRLKFTKIVPTDCHSDDDIRDVTKRHIDDYLKAVKNNARVYLSTMYSTIVSPRIRIDDIEREVSKSRDDRLCVDPSSDSLDLQRLHITGGENDVPHETDTMESIYRENDECEDHHYNGGYEADGDNTQECVTFGNDVNDSSDRMPRGNNHRRNMKPEMCVNADEIGSVDESAGTSVGGECVRDVSVSSPPEGKTGDIQTKKRRFGEFAWVGSGKVIKKRKVVVNDIIALNMTNVAK